MKPGVPSLQSTRLLDQLRERVRYMHYSLKTEKTYLYWIRFFIRWSATQSGGMRHPRELGVADMEAFLSMLAKDALAGLLAHGRRELAGGWRHRQPFRFTGSGLSQAHKRTGIPRSRIRSLACCTVYSP